MSKDKCFSLAFDNGTGNLTVILADIIDEWSARELITDVQAVSNLESVYVGINTNGGSVTAGLAMYNFLKGLEVPVVTEVLGIAASMGAVVLQAGDVRKAPANSFVMIHNTWGVGIGESPELRKIADLLDVMTTMIVGIFTDRTKQEESKIVDLLNEETYMTGEEALELGFIDEVTEAIDIAASIDIDKTDLPDDAKKLLAQTKKGKGNMSKEKELQETIEQLQGQLSTANEELGKSKAAQTEAHDAGVDAGRNEILEGRVKARMEKYEDSAFVLETIGESDADVASAYIKKLEADGKIKDAEILKLKSGDDDDPKPAGQKEGAPAGTVKFDQKAYDERVIALRGEGKSAREAHMQAKREMPQEKKA